jgi:1,4-dihydroxy-2-naphthoate octaprenyltransferase
MSILARLLLSLIALTLITYLLRGLGLLTFIPGGVILILIALSILSGILYGIEKTRRF